MGTVTVAGELAGNMDAAGGLELRIIPTFDCSSEYERQVLRGTPDGSAVMDSSVLSDLVRQYEPSDFLFILDPRYWPVEGIEPGFIERHGKTLRWVTHAVAVESGADGTLEQVHSDQTGRIRRIGRYYKPVTCTHISAIAYSLVPLASYDGFRFSSLGALRDRLCELGMLCRDESFSGGVIDLSKECGLLRLNEQRVCKAVKSRLVPGYSRLGPGVLVGDECRIHPSARLVGPVIIQEKVIVEAGATVFGPAVLGRGSRLGRDSVVAQSVVACGCIVPPGAQVRHRVATTASFHNERSTSVIVGHNSSVLPDRSNGRSFGSEVTGFEIEHAARRRTIYPIVKLLADKLAALVGLVVLSPLLAAVALLIKLDSPGGVFFGHAREGRGGKVFQCLKFRTMCADAHRQQRSLYQKSDVDGPQFKLRRDPRITAVGGWLRRTNIDELPQLINVLRGEMSLVGPRPSPFRENQICVPWRKARLSVRPGVTGLWQICRQDRTGGDFHQWIAYDVAYVRKLSFWLDVKVLAATVFSFAGRWRVPASWMIGTDPGVGTVRHRVRNNGHGSDR